MGTTRLRANRLALTIGGANYWSEVSKVELAPEYERTPTYDGPDYYPVGWTLRITAVQSLDAGSLWSLFWEHPNERLPFVYAPAGNEHPTPSDPHFIGEIHIPGRPSVGGAAAIRGDYTFSAVLDVIREPTKITS